ncbi:MAG: hypothetical protein GXP47_10650 [Acidobacteria bacterium]|nr:hypothetical protein [Acidobacteriota bacterium]
MGTVFRRLGELLLEDGVVTVSELHTALEACKRSGGRLGTHLLRLGYVPEPQLLKALGRQFGVQPVTSDHLVAEAAKFESSIPMDVQRRLKAVPFEQHGRVLSVAMVNPRDLAAREELERLSGLHVEPFVVTERAIRTALDASGSWTEVNADDAQEPTGLLEVRDLGSAWESLWRPSGVQPGALKAALSSIKADTPHVAIATFPGLMEIRGDEVPPMTMEELRSKLRFSRQRDEVGQLLLSFARQYLARAILLALQRDNLAGWLGGGREVSLEDVQALNVPVGESPALANMLSQVRPFTGRLGDDAGTRAVKVVLGPPPPREVLAVPVRIGRKAVAVLIGDQPDGGLGGVPVEVIAEAATRAGLALEILILTRKI